MSKREQNKLARKLQVIQAAKEIFDQEGIEATKMTSIADQAGIGVASVYRYFNTKGDIAMEVGVDYWEMIYNFLKSIPTDHLNGLDGLKALMAIYTTESHEVLFFFRFIERLDHFIMKMTEKPERFSVYEDAVNAIEPLFIEWIEKGIKDGSIRNDIDVRTSYVSISHSLTALKQKHCIRGLVLPSDTKEQMDREMMFLIDVFIQYLKK